MRTIFDYSDPNLYLKDKWEESKKKNPNLSVRSWATYLNVGAHGPLHQMILGKRKITQSYIPKFVKYFKLSEKEVFYFEVLIKFSRAQSIEETNFYLETMKELRPKNLDSIEILDNYDIQKEPLNFLIMELSELFDLRNDCALIKKKLSVECTSFEIKSALALLINSGQLKVDDQNILRKNSRTLYSTQDKKNMALVQYHQKLCAMAHSAVSKQDVLEREFNGVSFNIRIERMPEIKAEMRSFINQMIAKYEEPAKSGDSVYQLNTQFFKVGER